MKIAWVKACMYVDYDPNSSGKQCCEMRFGFWRELYRQGHTVTVFTAALQTAQKLQNKMIDGTYVKPKREIFLENDFIKDIEYKPTEFPDESYDVLFLETAATTWLFPCPETKIRQYRRTAEILERYKGVVVIWQTDPDLPFPYWKMSMSKYTWFANKNPYRTVRFPKKKDYPELEEYGWSSFRGIFENKTHLLFTFSTRPEIVAEKYSGSRDKYSYFVKEGLLKVYGFPTPYLDDYVEQIPFNENPEFDIMYSGYPRRRENRFDLFFNNIGKRWKRVVTGKKWESACKYPLKKRVSRLGFLKLFVDVPLAVNKAKVALHLGVPKTTQFYWTTCRAVEAIFAKAIVLYDCKLKAYDDILGSKFSVSTTDEAKAKYKMICNLSNEERKKLWQEQYELVKHLTWKNYVIEIEKVLKEYIKK